MTFILRHKASKSFTAYIVSESRERAGELVGEAFSSAWECLFELEICNG